MVTMDKNLEAQHKAQVRSTAECQAYYFESESQVAAFDSINSVPEARPEVVQQLFDSIGEQFHPKLDLAVSKGIKAYQERNGGELPHASVISAALHAGLSVLKDNHGVQGFDSIQALHSEAASVVPAQSIVTIASVIANSLPFIAILPNTINSNLVPVVSVRFVADSDFAATKAGDHMDGEKAALPYFEGRFGFALVLSTGSTYTVTPRTQYLSFTAKTPDTSAPVLPFVPSNISIRLNGLEIGNTRDRKNSKIAGSISATAKDHGVVIGSTEYKLTGSAINLDTGLISVTLNQAIPAGAQLTVHLVADWQAKDPATKVNKIQPCGIDVETEFDTVMAASARMTINVSIESMNQMAQELGLGFVGACIGIMQGKYYLEQNSRLLRDGKELAKLNGWVESFDASRSAAGNLAAAVNTTGDLIGEVFKYIDKVILDIAHRSGGTTSMYDLVVGDNGSLFFKQLPAEKFTPTGAFASSYGEMVRIGSTPDGKNVYHSPNPQQIISESDTTSEILVIGRSAQPVRNPFVGFIATPPTVVSAQPVSEFETNCGVHANMAAEQNPLPRYAKQLGVVEMSNLPAFSH